MDTDDDEILENVQNPNLPEIPQGEPIMTEIDVNG
jgi:hypothetical protein